MRTAGKSPTILFKGMNEDEDWSNDPSWADHVENMERDPSGTWRTMAGTVQVGTWADTDNILIGITWFQPRPNHRFLVVEQNAAAANRSKLQYIDWTTGVATDFATRARVPGRTGTSQFVQLERWLYHFNGLEAPIRWDGDVVMPMGFSGPTPAPFASGGSQGTALSDLCGAVLTASALDIDLSQVWNRGVADAAAPGEDPLLYQHAYGMTLVNDLGQESPMSSLVIVRGYTDPASTDYVSGKRSTLVQVPILPRHAMGCRLWRSTNLVGGTADLPELYRLRDFPSTGGGFQFVDDAPDSELGELFLPEERGPVPLGIRCAAFHHNSMWVAVDNLVYRSAPNQPEVFPSGNRYPVGASGTGSVLAMWSVPRGLVIMCARGVYMAKGNPVEGYRIETVSERVECCGPRAMSYVDGMGLCLVTADGPQLLQGTLDDDGTTKLVPLPGIRKTWKRYVSPRGQANAIVVHRPEVEEVWFHVCRMGEIRPSLGLVYHYGGGGSGWSLRPDWKFAAAVSYQGRTWLGSWDITDELTVGVHLISRGGVGVAAATADAGPPDPSEPISFTYSEPYPQGDTLTWFWRTPSNRAIVGVYESGTLRSPVRISPQSVELLGTLTGGTRPLQVEVRYDRRVHFEQIDDEEWQQALHSEQVDEDDTQQRATWGESVWDPDRMWTEMEPGAVRLPMPREAQFEVQYRVRGLDLRVSGARTELDPRAPDRKREVS